MNSGDLRTAKGSGMRRDNKMRAAQMSQHQRWIDAIGADLSAIIKFMAAVARRTVENYPGWQKRAAGWFRFVGRRRIDKRHGIFPGGLRAAEFLAVAGSIIAAVVLFVDPLFLEIVRSSNAGGHPVFRFITRFGQSDWILIATGIIIIVMSLATADRFHRHGRIVAHRIFLNAWYLFTTVAFSGLLANLAKNLIGRARPSTLTGDDIWVSAPFADRYDFAAFPSGHATTAGALAIALGLLFPRFRVFFWLAGAWIAVSRPALGVHFPSDMLAGFLFGAAFSYVYARSFARRRLLFRFKMDGSLQLRGEGGMAAFLDSQLRETIGRISPPRQT